MCNYNEGILSLLLDRGAEIDARVRGGKSLLHIAASHEQGLGILQLLLNRGADINLLTEAGQSLVHFAADHPTSAMLDRLVDQGAHLDVAGKEGATPLLLAARADHLETLIALMKRGARVDTTDIAGKTLVHVAVTTYNPEMVEFVLRTQSVNVLDMKGRTPLHYAYFASTIASKKAEVCMTRSADVIRQLLEKGASETSVDSYGRTPKDYLSWSICEHESRWICRNFYTLS